MPAAPPRRRWGSFPTTADEGIWAEAESPEGLFEALGLGLFALMTDLDTVRPSETRSVSARGMDLPELVVDWLTQLLVLEDTEAFLAREATVELTGSPPTGLRAELRGEILDPARHPRRKEVKAVTLHALEIDLAAGRARVIVDI